MAELSVPREKSVYRCKHCGAPLKVGPDTVVALCEYCGTPNWIRGEPSSLYLAKPLSIDVIRERFEEFKKKDPDLAKLNIIPARIEVVLLPFYLGNGKVKSDYEASGTLTVQVVRKRGDRFVTETISKPFHVSGTFSTSISALVSGKRVLGEEAADELAEHFSKARPMLASYEEFQDSWNREVFKALGADYDSREARAILEDDICDWLRERVDEVIKERARRQYVGPGTVISVHIGRKMVPCNIEALDVKGPLFLPLVKIFYVYDGKIYRAYFAGWDMKPLLREEPFTATQRIAMIGLGGAIGGGGFAGAVAALTLLSGWESLVAAGFLFIVGLAGGYFVSKAGLSEARIERGEAGSWVSSIISTAEEKS